jgi:hypothetical protein
MHSWSAWQHVLEPASAWARNRYMETTALSAVLQVGFGGALVFVTGIMIGRS